MTAADSGSRAGDTGQSAAAEYTIHDVLVRNRTRLYLPRLLNYATLSIARGSWLALARNK